MPQFDTFIFSSSLLYFIIAFFILLTCNFLRFLPRLSAILKLRSKLAVKLNDISVNTRSYGTLDHTTDLNDSKNNQLIMLKQYSFLHKILRKFLKVIFLWILFVRSFFVKRDLTKMVVLYFIPATTLVFIKLSNEYPSLFSQFTAVYFYTYVGIQLITYDELGSRISHHILYGMDPIITVNELIKLANHENFLFNFAGTSGITGIFIGKTSMTATGRATLLAALFTGGTWLYNSQMDRNAADARSRADRDAADYREAKARAYQNYQDAKKEHTSTPFYKQKPVKPTWDESSWENWSKTK